MEMTLSSRNPCLFSGRHVKICLTNLTNVDFGVNCHVHQKENTCGCCIAVSLKLIMTNSSSDVILEFSASDLNISSQTDSVSFSSRHSSRTSLRSWESSATYFTSFFKVPFLNIDSAFNFSFKLVK